jgi:hypothetical protein
MPAALAGALLAVVAGLIAPNNLVAFYLTALGAALLLFGAFLAYLEAAEQLDVRTGAVVASAGLAAGLVMADAALRFPAVLDPHAPSGAGALAVAALVVVIAGLSIELWQRQVEAAPVPARVRLRELLHR